MEKIIKTLIFFYLVLFPFGQLTRLPIRITGFPEINLYLTDFLVGVLVIIHLIGKINKEKKNKFKLTSLAKLMAFFLGIAVLSLLINIHSFEKKEILVGGLYWLRLFAYFVFYLIISSYNLNNLLDLLLVSGEAVAVFGLVQYFLWPDLSFLTTFGWDPHYYRLAGTFFDPNFTGIILVLTIILLLVNFKNKPIYYLLLALDYFSLALTYSRASYLSLMAGITVILIRKKSFKLLSLIFFIMLVTIIILPRKTGGEGVKLARISSVKSRLGSWYQAIIIYKDYPFFGVGFNNYRYIQKKYGFLNEDWKVSHSGAGVDNSFLFVLATTGILGFLFFLVLLGKILVLSFRKSLFIFASIVAILTHAFFNNTLFYPWVLGWLAIILGKL